MSEQTNRTAEITAALIPAYQNASLLKLTKAEIKGLMKPFPESVIEILPDGAIYLPHIYISERLNEVFGPAAWTLICRVPAVDKETQTITTEHVLVIRGCMISEAFGQAHFDESMSKKSAYGDVMDTLAAKALRQICGKRLSCGSQLWQPEFAKKWQDKHGEKYEGEVFEGRETKRAMLWKKKGAKAPINPATEAPAVILQKYVADENQRDIMLQLLTASASKEIVLAFAIAKDILKIGQNLQDWPLDKVVVNELDTIKLQREIEAFAPAEEKVDEKPKESAWKSFRLPYGGKAGCPLGELPLDILAAYWADRNSEVNRKSYAKFVEHLEQAGKEMNFSDLKSSKKK